MNLTTVQALELKETIKQIHSKLDRVNILLQIEMTPRSCSNCTNFSDADIKPLCQKFNAEPPDEVLKTGCEHWEYDDIPF